MAEALAYEIVIIGGGPAGIAAACAAAECDKQVLVVDNMPAPGGNIWRGTGTPGHPKPPLFEKWSARLKQVERQPRFLNGATIFAAPVANRLLAETAEGVIEIQWQKLILATGARELFLPFPGWTLPNVFGVGGLQALAKGGWPVKGKRIVIGGTGPLLLACGAQLRAEGATVPWIAEQAPFGKLFGMGMQLPLLAPSKISQGMGLKWALRGVPFKMGTWVTEARGKGKVESVVITDGAKSREIACDYLACGYNLIPNLEVPRLLGCAIENGAVTTDDWGETPLEGVFATGE
ncbi:MAG TPA: FAD/NAD(P)-binding oxidoreductase, partial [Phycisphaerae bacterium]|nr:FAD/NAD(P)-binding oxidoreductase [Phycisphaerae bacterium]